MRVRLVRREGDKFMLMAEQGTRKGKKVTTGDTVTRDGLREATRKLVNQVRGPGGPEPA